MQLLGWLQRLTGWFTGPAGVELTEADEPEKARKLRKMLRLFLQVLLLPSERTLRTDLHTLRSAEMDLLAGFSAALLAAIC